MQRREEEGGGERSNERRSEQGQRDCICTRGLGHKCSVAG